VLATHQSAESICAQLVPLVATGANESLTPALRRYRLNPRATILNLDTSHREPMYQVCVGDYRYQINRSTFGLLMCLQEPRTLPEVQESAQRENIRLPDSELEQVLELLVSKNKVVLVDDGGPVQNELEKLEQVRSRNGSFTLHFRLFTPEALRPITSRLRHLFSLSAVYLCLSFAVASHMCFAWFYATLPRGQMHPLSTSAWCVLALLVYLGVFFHELGHAAACVRYGVRHGEIGIGIYIIYPVFYSNVTECWSLPHFKRAVVDIGGLYFQMLFSSVFCIAWMVTQVDIFRYVVLSMIAGAALNLNPFLRFDGYWLLTDLTGFPSIHRSTYEFWQFVCRKCLREDTATRRAEFLDRGSVIKVVFILYAVASMVFFAYFAFRIGHGFLPYLFHIYVRDFPQLVAYGRHLDFSITFWQLLLHIAMLSLSCWGLGRMSVDIGKKILAGLGDMRHRAKARLHKGVERVIPGGVTHVTQ